MAKIICMNFKTMSEIYLGSLGSKLRERLEPVYCHFAQGSKASKALAAIPGILADNNIIAYNENNASLHEGNSEKVNLT